MSVHREAEVGFRRSAEAYERGRPGYPEEALGLLAERLPLGPGTTVLDLAAGTGKLTRPLLARGARVIAVEPLAEMRALLPAEADALEGTAERIPLDAGAVDAVTVAQAFHWFDGPRALAEVHRVLRPGGTLALVWNRRVHDDPANRAIEEIVGPYRGDTPSERTEAWRLPFGETDLFGPLIEHRFANRQRLDAGALADRVLSISFIASLPEPERERVAAATRALAAEGPLEVSYDAQVHLCERLRVP